jgi:AcrR family transcriptional regulator
VAERAGVSEATVYSVYGSKAGLASSLIDAAEHSADVGRTVVELGERGGDPVGQLRAFVAFDRRLFEHGGDVIRVLAEARRQHPELGAAYQEGRSRGERERRTVFSSWPSSVWHDGVDVGKALAVYALMVSLEGYDIATTEHGWSPDEVEEWWHRTLAKLLLR